MAPPAPPPRRPAARPTWRRGLAVALGTTLALATLAAAAEAVARRVAGDSAAVARENDWVDATVEFWGPCFEVEGRGAHARLLRTRSRSGAPPPPPPPPLPRARTPGVARVAIVGESNAAILGELARVQLGQVDCGRRIEVLSCGVQGAPWEVTAQRIDEVLGYAPDAILMVFGHNYRFTHPRVPPWRVWVLRQRRRSVLLTLLAAQLPAWPGQPPAVDSAEPLQDAHGERLDGARAQDERRRRRFQALLDGLVDRVRARGVALVLTTMASNLRLPPPATDADLAAPEYLEAQFREASGQRDAAVRGLLAASARAPAALWEHQAGMWLLADGRAEEARAHLARALELDLATPRTPAAVNDHYRALAAGGRAGLHDQERAVTAAAPDHVPGWETFEDCCHFVPGRAGREAAALLAAGDGARGVATTCPVPAEPPRPDEDWRDFLIMTDLGILAGPRAGGALQWQLAVADALRRHAAADAAGADRAVEAFLAGPGMARASPRARGRALAGFALGYWLAGRVPQALAVNAQACDADPGAEPWVQRGLWLLALGRAAEARAALGRAVAREPGRADASYFLGRLGGAAPP